MSQKRIEIITHDGRFHTDELMAIALIKSLYVSTNNEFKITRTRDQNCINKRKEVGGTNVYVVDVGKKYEPENQCFDHHQSKCVDTFSKDFKTPLSSFGMVYKHLGVNTITEFIETNYPNEKFPTNKTIEKMYKNIYGNFVESFDKADNGYVLKNDCFTFIEVISNKNSLDPKINNSRFGEALELCEKVLFDYMNGFLKNHFDYANNYNTILTKYKSRTHPNIVIFDEPINYMSCLKKIDRDNEILFIIVPNLNKTLWQLHTMKSRVDNFTNIADLIPHERAKFIHANRFYGVCKTKEDALAVVEASVKEYKEKDKLGKTTVHYLIAVATIVSVGYALFRTYQND